MPESGVSELHEDLTIGYLSGPVDARSVLNKWKEGGQTDLFGSSYMSLFATVVRNNKARCVIITSHDGLSYDSNFEEFTILNRQKWKIRGPLYHVAMSVWCFLRILELYRQNCRVAVLTDAQDYWFVTLPFRVLGMKFVNSYHCVLWPIKGKTINVRGVFTRITSWMHLAFSDRCMAVSDRIKAQLMAETGRNRSVDVFKPHYSAQKFAQCTRHDKLFPGSEFNILFAGRAERNKGVFDLLEACEIILKSGRKNFKFHLHGEGAALEELKELSQKRHLSDNFFVYGFTKGDELSEHYARSHAVVVPTRSDFEEGLAKSVVEGILALRPVLTSKACPAIDTLMDACVECEVDSAESYARNFIALAETPNLYDQKVDAAARLRDLFFDPPDNYGAALSKNLSLALGRPLEGLTFSQS